MTTVDRCDRRCRGAQQVAPTGSWMATSCTGSSTPTSKASRVTTSACTCPPFSIRMGSSATMTPIEIYLDIAGDGPLSAEQSRALARILLDAADQAEHGKCCRRAEN